MMPEKASSAINFFKNFWQPWNAPKGERTAPIIGFIAATILFFPLFLPAVGIAALVKWAIKPIKESDPSVQAQADVVQGVVAGVLTGELREGVHGKKDWNARGVNVGEVPPPPQELLEALYKPCPIANDGSKMIDTHVILWMPPKVNGEPITVDNLENMAKADAFGENKIGYEFIYKPIRGDAAINQPLEGGYWLALYKRPVAGGLSFADQKKYIADNCPGYEVPKTREVIASSVMQYGCSGDKKERILARERAVSYCRCEEQISGRQVIVGALASSGLNVYYLVFDADGVHVGVCPVRKFF